MSPLFAVFLVSLILVVILGVSVIVKTKRKYPRCTCNTKTGKHEYWCDLVTDKII